MPYSQTHVENCLTPLPFTGNLGPVGEPGFFEFGGMESRLSALGYTPPMNSGEIWGPGIISLHLNNLKSSKISILQENFFMGIPRFQSHIHDLEEL